jgi:dTDP-4-amino-4,6-dideoxy-D-galactose acyltransferase
LLTAVEATSDPTPAPLAGKPVCDFLEWDSAHFGYRIARAAGNRLDRSNLGAMLAWCETHQIDCLYFLADSHDGQTIRLAEATQFSLVDVRLTLDRHLDRTTTPCPVSAGLTIREWRPGDLAALRAIARQSYRDTRFYYDGHFATASVDALYETWIEKSCRGYADAVLVAEAEQQAAGYLSCHILDGAWGQVGLVGVHPAWQGQGIGHALVDSALGWFAARGLQQVRIVTQGRNIAAQRLYGCCGFLPRTLQLWYHRWFPSGSAMAAGTGG